VGTNLGRHKLYDGELGKIRFDPDMFYFAIGLGEYKCSIGYHVRLSK
jgi:hypothetical protein